MTSWKSRLPEPVKRRGRRIAQMWNRRKIAKGGLRHELARTREERDQAAQARDRARELHEEAKRQRDQSRESAKAAMEHARSIILSTREELRAERAKSSALLRRMNSPDDGWLESRDHLSGGRASDLQALYFYPSATLNPYLRVLYSRSPEFGFDPRPLAAIEDLGAVAPSAMLHLHWTRVAQAGARSADEARASTQAFLAPIEDFVARGGQLIWTVHEPLPHDCAYPDIEIGLRERLAELAAAIHILHPSTLDEARPFYDIHPEKAFVVEHPTYHGAYDDYVPRASARKWLGIDDDTFLILAFGTIRPYKGFDRIVRLLPEIRRRSGRDVQVLVCGSLLSDDESTEMRELVAATEGAAIADTGIPGSAVHILFRAADLAVLPYRAVLNSGVLMLSLTFGIPTIAPRNPVTEDASLSGLLHLFSPDSEQHLLDVTLEAIALDRRPPVATPAEWLSRHAPEPIAGEFGLKLRDVRLQFTAQSKERQ